MILAWDGKTHIVQNYIDRGTYATIELADDYNNNQIPLEQESLPHTEQVKL